MDNIINIDRTPDISEGDHLRCIDIEEASGLTLNKIYTCIERGTSRYITVVNDMGRVSYYNKSRFKRVRTEEVEIGSDLIKVAARNRDRAKKREMDRKLDNESVKRSYRLRPRGDK